jgi:hypothetical protein
VTGIVVKRAHWGKMVKNLPTNRATLICPQKVFFIKKVMAGVAFIPFLIFWQAAKDLVKRQAFKFLNNQCFRIRPISQNTTLAITLLAVRDDKDFQPAVAT